MPTYSVSTTHGLLSTGQKAQIASAITHAHSGATGAQAFFAQVMFTSIEPGAHFMGGVPIDTQQIFVHGHIRAGRTEDQRRTLMADVVKALHDITGLPRRFIWVYLSELPPVNMIEYGQVLPLPGTEDQWLASLPQEDREYMLSLRDAR